MTLAGLASLCSMETPGLRQEPPAPKLFPATVLNLSPWPQTSLSSPVGGPPCVGHPAFTFPNLPIVPRTLLPQATLDFPAWLSPDPRPWSLGLGSGHQPRPPTPHPWNPGQCRLLSRLLDFKINFCFSFTFLSLGFGINLNSRSVHPMRSCFSLALKGCY